MDKFKDFFKGFGNIGGSMSKDPTTFFPKRLTPNEMMRNAWCQTGSAIKKSLHDYEQQQRNGKSK